ncbi:efflux RND transporter periplasmic adaptor subunit [Paenibacillus cremeus]|uniref:efflux RND transporter periplasmic adaptor subunit n=1 Tax=Paenibacillus cremeus TaxID=2163881 RepID=UPI0021BCFDB9|nr:efflux RND transporter periplasmic adaptor subunit [Paenibacillus cremeus]
MNKKKTIIIVLAAILAAGGGSAAYIYQGKTAAKKTTASAQQTVKVTRGNLRSTITGTSQLEAQDVQMIVPPKEGVIKTLNLTRNQPVKKGDLLLELTDSTITEKMDSTQQQLSTYQSDMQDLLSQQGALKTLAPVSGKLILATNLSEGTSVSKTTKIATIANPDTLTVTLPFVQEEVSQLHKGDTIELTIDGFMLTKTGTVDSISTGANADAKGNRLASVTVRVDNDGTMDADLNVQGAVMVNGLKVQSTAKAKTQYQTTTPVFANVNGTISKLEYKDSRSVKAGELLATIVSDSLSKDITSKQQQIDQANKSIADLTDQLNNLKVYAPFDGVFSTDFADPKKNVLTSYPVGTTIESGTKLGAVASLDTLQLPISVDELDLPKIKTGQKAVVRVDAISGKTFDAEVTQVSTVGTTTNGVSTYTVVLSMKSSPELKYGMTASADIIIQDKQKVLTLPIQAVQNRGGKHFVSVQGADGKLEQKEVKVGVNSSTMIEITEGLNEGDQVVVQGTTTRQNNLSQQQIDQLRQQFQQGAGGAGGGGFPGGGGFQGGGGGGATRGGNR